MRAWLWLVVPLAGCFQGGGTLGLACGEDPACGPGERCRDGLCVRAQGETGTTGASATETETETETGGSGGDAGGGETCNGNGECAEGLVCVEAICKVPDAACTTGPVPCQSLCESYRSCGLPFAEVDELCGRISGPGGVCEVQIVAFADCFSNQGCGELGRNPDCHAATLELAECIIEAVDCSLLDVMTPCDMVCSGLAACPESAVGPVAGCLSHMLDASCGGAGVPATYHECAGGLSCGAPVDDLCVMEAMNAQADGCGIHLCGDGVQVMDVESCDDMNQIDGDACPAGCM